ncbi:MAG TPA: GNAT family N-acetyltransferase [Gaiellaceae bacterium]|nr:GNAT family N-acetyltransferase [Gaiellaceae bacterium]
METAPQTTIRRLGPGDEAVVEALAEQAEPRTALLRDERTVFLAAFAGERPVGFAFGYLLPRRHGKPASMFVYEIAVEERYRRRGIATDLMRSLLAEAPEAFVLTELDNDAANALYASLGGTRSEAAMWEW